MEIFLLDLGALSVLSTDSLCVQSYREAHLLNDRRCWWFETMCSDIPPADLCFGGVDYVSIALCQGLRM